MYCLCIVTWIYPELQRYKSVMQIYAKSSLRGELHRLLGHDRARVRGVEEERLSFVLVMVGLVELLRKRRL